MNKSNTDVIVQTPLHPSTVPQAPQLGKQPLTEESTRGKGEESERLHTDYYERY